MIIYLAGPMTGIPDYNFPEFIRCGDALEKLGHTVWNPAKMDMALDGFDPVKDRAKAYKHYMERDLPAVCKSDVVVVLPGWEKSKGARLETHVAHECEIPVITFNQFVTQFGKST